MIDDTGLEPSGEVPPSGGTDKDNSHEDANLESGEEEEEEEIEEDTVKTLIRNQTKKKNGTSKKFGEHRELMITISSKQTMG